MSVEITSSSPHASTKPQSLVAGTVGGPVFIAKAIAVLAMSRSINRAAWNRRPDSFEASVCDISESRGHARGACRGIDHEIGGGRGHRADVRLLMSP